MLSIEEVYSNRGYSSYISTNMMRGFHLPEVPHLRHAPADMPCWSKAIFIPDHDFYHHAVLLFPGILVLISLNPSIPYKIINLSEWWQPIEFHHPLTIKIIRQEIVIYNDSGLIITYNMKTNCQQKINLDTMQWRTLCDQYFCLDNLNQIYITYKSVNQFMLMLAKRNDARQPYRNFILLSSDMLNGTTIMKLRDLQLTADYLYCIINNSLMTIDTSTGDFITRTHFPKRLKKPYLSPNNLYTVDIDRSNNQYLLYKLTPTPIKIYEDKFYYQFQMLKFSSDSRYFAILSRKDPETTCITVYQSSRPLHSIQHFIKLEEEYDVITDIVFSENNQHILLSITSQDSSAWILLKLKNTVDCHHILPSHIAVDTYPPPVISGPV